MSQNKVKLSEVISDFIVTLDSDDYASNASDIAIKNFALRGIREIGFDLGKKVRSLKLDVNASNNTVALPTDFVDMVKIGVVGSDGVVRVFGENKHINYSQVLTDGTRTDSKSSTTGNDGDTGSEYPYVFENYLYQGGLGRLYGVGGGNLAGGYRINLDQNRIEIDTNSGQSQVVMEYIADEARSDDPEVHVYAEEALRSYMYYRIVERKSTVPAAEKSRARQEYYNERRKANARMSNFTKEEALKTIRKNFKQAPKY
jgi:hypothetical protein